jgi:hypothetical protein
LRRDIGGNSLGVLGESAKVWLSQSERLEVEFTPARRRCQAVVKKFDIRECAYRLLEQTINGTLGRIGRSVYNLLQKDRAPTVGCR